MKWGHDGIAPLNIGVVVLILLLKLLVNCYSLSRWLAVLGQNWSASDFQIWKSSLGIDWSEKSSISHFLTVSNLNIIPVTRDETLFKLLLSLFHNTWADLCLINRTSPDQAWRLHSCRNGQWECLYLRAIRIQTWRRICGRCSDHLWGPIMEHCTPGRPWNL